MPRALFAVAISACWSAEPAPPPASAAPAGVPLAAPVAACVATATEVPGIDPDDPRLSADHLIVVRKAARRVQLFEKGTAAVGSGAAGRACYRVGLGFAPDGHKTREGDGRTPEGWYATSDKPWSSFYAAIAVHYPNGEDARAAAEDGRISVPVRDAIATAERAGKKTPQTTAMGGEILLHGGGSSTDWTLGCIALDNADLDDLRRHLPKDMKVLVRILP